MTDTLARLAVPGAVLGEGPCWDAATGALYWVDIPVGRIHRLAGDGAHRSWEAGQTVGAVVLRASGGLVLAAADGFLALDPGTGAVSPLVALGLAAGVRMNAGA